MSETRRFISIEQVAKHNGIDDTRTWIIIKDIVYDVTDYMEKHPGGSELLKEYAGKDGTSGFDDFGHSSDAKKILKSYKIGELCESDRMANRSKKNKTMTNNDSKTNEENRGNNSTRQTRRSFLRVICGGCV